ncbi:MAG: serine O-acetyltransferase EpsC [Myxococcota bacterium]|nr:serine O-acetyltransferase EpsC [Myxococcota bacterium]
MSADLHKLRRPDAAYSDTIEALAECHEDALSKAACGGLLNPDEAIDWALRTQRLLLFERDRSALRSEIPALAERLEVLVAQVDIADGVSGEKVVRRTIERLPAVRSLIAEDVAAAYAGDPAARTYDEIVVAYPSVFALAIYRIAHELHVQGVALLPRIMSEYAHGRTGIDIHPGATIGHHFFIDHGTGVVIGETAQIGERVRVYQGVTIGAASVRDSDELRGQKRHPTVEDDVTIYAGATILGGGTTIGRGSVIGGNVWITESVPPNSRVMAEPARNQVQRDDDDLQLGWDLS